MKNKEIVRIEVMQIKFRLIKNGKVVGYEWHKLTTKGNRIRLMHSNNNRNWKEIFGSAQSYCGWIVHDKKEQFTGLLDKNGKEAYCKDFLQDDHNNKYIIEWIEVAASFQLVNIKDLTIHLWAEAIPLMEIIGNQTDNPELSKGEE